jgi:hypothetical protein
MNCLIATRKMATHFDDCDLGEDRNLRADPTVLRCILSHQPLFVFICDVDWTIEFFRPPNISRFGGADTRHASKRNGGG